MNTVEIIRKWLNENGYDGLVDTNGPCGCNLDDFMPCGGEYVAECRAAYKQPCKRDPKAFCMVSKKGVDLNCENCDVLSQGQGNGFMDTGFLPALLL